MLHPWKGPGTCCGQAEREVLGCWYPAAFAFKTKKDGLDMLKDGLDMLSPDCTVQLYLT